MENIELWNKLKEVPSEMQSTIEGGALKGFTKINSQWRLQKLTETFGAVGKGWRIEVVEKWVDNILGKMLANLQIKLYYNIEGGVYEITGFGSAELTKGTSSLNTDAWKMAFTDAISSCCRQLGIGASVYFQDKNDQEFDKYNSDKKERVLTDKYCAYCGKQVDERVAKYSQERFNEVVCWECQKSKKHIAEVKGGSKG